jgi:hypothetical protein
MNNIKITKEGEAVKFASRLSFLYIVLGVLGFVLIMIPMLLYSNEKLDNIGIIGDTVGGILNPIFAVPATLLTFLAFWVQYKANQQQQKDIAIQRFESVFFEMIRLHKENVNEMKISGYGVLKSNSIESRGGEIIMINSNTQIERFVEGRKTFVSMIKELVACYNFCQEFKSKISDKELLEIGYKLFFYGSVSSSISKKEDSVFIYEMRNKLKTIREEHKREFGLKTEFNTRNGIVSLHIKYAPYTGHESRLAHYYRHLFSTVKFVVKKEEEGLFDYSQSREYLKMLRAQLSNDEQLMLYYNYINGMGSEWENDKNKFFSHYRMLHNLPLNRVKFVEDPRKHFEKQIQDINIQTNGLEQMFESGDILKA